MRGACSAAVGKHALNLDSDTVDSVFVSADENSVENLDARGPGVRGMGGRGGGEGESRVVPGISFSPPPLGLRVGGLGKDGGLLHTSVVEECCVILSGLIVWVGLRLRWL